MIRKLSLHALAAAFGIAYFIAFYELASSRVYRTHKSHGTYVAVQP